MRTVKELVALLDELDDERSRISTEKYKSSSVKSSAKTYEKTSEGQRYPQIEDKSYDRSRTAYKPKKVWGERATTSKEKQPIVEFSPSDEEKETMVRLTAPPGSKVYVGSKTVRDSKPGFNSKKVVAIKVDKENEAVNAVSKQTIKSENEREELDESCEENVTEVDARTVDASQSDVKNTGVGV